MQPPAWSIRGGDVALDRPLVMGIVNATPDSFSDGGSYPDSRALCAAARQLIADGADLIDIGGESTRPGARDVSASEEWSRVAGAVKVLASEGCVVSIDTSKLAVAEKAIEAGARVVNDVTALRHDPGIAQLCASSGAGLVLMHMRGTPRTMQDDTVYDDVVGDVLDYLLGQVDGALASGCAAEQIVIDPGIGFGKSVEGNLHLLASTRRFVESGYPVLVGPSRKSFIGKVLNLPVEERLEGTIAACLCAFERGARLFRVHDVGPVRRALDMAHALVSAG